MARIESTPLRMIGAVLVTCAVAASSLAFTYELTHERIIEQERIAREKALQEVVSDAVSFEEMDADIVEAADEAAGETPVLAIFEAETESGVSALGVVVAPRGYGGPMQMVVGLDRDGKVLGVSIITQNETPGLGTKILSEEWFLEQFTGWDGSDIDSAAKQFDAISGATKSSAGVRKGVIAAGHAYEAVIAETEGGS